MRDYVLVYGTLRIGCSNYRWMENANGVYKGTYKIAGYKLHDLGPYPGIKRGTDEDYVVCELFEADIDVLDVLEGYYEDMPENGLYDREKVAVPESLLDAWIYVYNHNVRGTQVINDWVEQCELGC